MSARGKARKRALDVLFAAEMQGRSILEAWAEHRAAAPGGVNELTVELVEGVQEHAERIDQIITEYSREWPLARMPAVDRNVLRLAIYEVLWSSETPDPVAVSEALRLVRELSTDDSPGFVNGILGSVVRDQERLARSTTAGP